MKILAFDWILLIILFDRGDDLIWIEVGLDHPQSFSYSYLILFLYLYFYQYPYVIFILPIHRLISKYLQLTVKQKNQKNLNLNPVSPNMTQKHINTNNQNREAMPSQLSYCSFTVQSLPHTYKQQLIRICEYLQEQQLNPCADEHPVNKNIIPQISVNICALFQCIRILHFMGKYQVPYPSAMKALQIVNFLLNTCEIPCINLIQTYILPSLYKTARYYAQQKNKLNSNAKPLRSSISSILRESRNSNRTKINYKTNPHERLCQQYQQSCFQLIIKWSYIKGKKIYQNQQTCQNSIFYELMINLTNNYMKKYNIQIQQFLKKDYKYIINKIFPSKADILVNEIEKLRCKYIGNLQQYGNHQTNCKAKQYSFYFINLFIQQQRSQKQENEQISPTKIYENLTAPNKLQNIIKCLPKLDIGLLFKTLDPVLTYPINQKLFSILQKQQSDLSAMIVALKIVSKLVIWADLETYLNIVYSEQIECLAKQVLQIKGYLSIEEGKHIMPLNKQQPQTTKIKLYKQLLYFLQVFSLCKIPELDRELGQITIRSIMNKISDLNYIIPNENKINGKTLCIKFSKNRQINNQRNQIWFKNIEQMNVKQSIKSKSVSLSLDTISKNPASSSKNYRIQLSANQNEIMSLTVLGLLKQQLVQMVEILESSYQQAIQLLQQQKILLQQKIEKNKIKSSTKINSINKKILSIKQQVMILKQQIILNQKQTDQQIKAYLEDVTLKAKSVLGQITKNLYKLELTYRDVLDSNIAQEMILDQEVVHVSDQKLYKNASVKVEVNPTVSAVNSHNEIKKQQSPSELQQIKSQIKCRSFSVSQAIIGQVSNRGSIQNANKIMKYKISSNIISNDIPSLILSTNQLKNKNINSSANLIINDYRSSRTNTQKQKQKIGQNQSKIKRQSQQTKNIETMLNKLSLQKRSSSFKKQNNIVYTQTSQYGCAKTTRMKQLSTKVNDNTKSHISSTKTANCIKQTINIPNIQTTMSVDQIVMPNLIPGIASFPKNQPNHEYTVENKKYSNLTSIICDKQPIPKTFKDCIKDLKKQILIPNNHKITNKEENLIEKRRSIKNILKQRSKSNNNLQLRYMISNEQYFPSSNLQLGINTKVQLNSSHFKEQNQYYHTNYYQKVRQEQKQSSSPYSRIKQSNGSRIKLTRIRSQSDLNPSNTSHSYSKSKRRSYLNLTKNLIKQQSQQKQNTQLMMQNKKQTIHSPRYAKRPIQLQNKRQVITHCEYINERITNQNVNVNQKIVTKQVNDQKSTNRQIKVDQIRNQITQKYYKKITNNIK